MTRNFTIILLAALTVFLWAHRTNHYFFFPDQAAAPVPKQTYTVDDTSTGSGENSVDHVDFARQFEIQTLENELSQERETLISMRTQLASLQTQQQEQQKNVVITYSSQITAAENQIQNLLDTLNAQNLAEKEISDAAGRKLQEQQTEQQVAKLQVDQRITAAEQNRTYIIEQINFWMNNPYQPYEQQTKLNELRNQLIIQEQELNDLRSERLSIAQDILLRTRDINAAVEDEKSDLYSEQASIRDEIAQLRENIRQLQNTRAQSNMSLAPLADQISAIQQNLNLQDEKVRALEANLRALQNE